ncbi:MAG: hypothetical protein ACMUHB_06610 [Thermoplasmatota archaeon]
MSMMRRYHVIPLMVILLPVAFSISSGCLDSEKEGNTSGIGDDSISIDLEESGSGYLEEREEQTVLVIEIGEDQLLSKLTFELRWTDEEPEDRIRRYVNEGDEFLIKVTEGENATIMESGKNMEGTEGRILLDYPCDLADNQTDPRHCVLELTVFLVDAGEQHPWYTGEDRASIEDTGNDFIWKVEYSYLDRNGE